MHIQPIKCVDLMIGSTPLVVRESYLRHCVSLVPMLFSTVWTVPWQICAIKDIIHTLVADMHSLRRNVPALHRSDTATSLQFNSDLSGYGGRSRTDSLLTETQGASFCHEGSAAMLEHDASHLRQVVESLDANLSLKLAQINRRLTMGGSSGVRKSRPGKLEDDLSAHADHNHLKFLSGQMS